MIELGADQIAQHNLRSFRCPPGGLSAAMSCFIPVVLDIVSVLRKVMSVEAVLILQDSGPVLVVPGESARILRARDDAGCSITVHNGSVDHRCVLNGWKVQHFLGDPPHAYVVIAISLKALKPVLLGTIGCQRHVCNARSTDKSLSCGMQKIRQVRKFRKRQKFSEMKETSSTSGWLNEMPPEVIKTSN